MLKRVFGLIFALPFAAASQAADVAQPDATFTIESSAISDTNIQWTSGTLTTKDGKEVAFTLSGVKLKQAGIAKTSLTGKVSNLSKPEDFAGTYQLMTADPNAAPRAAPADPTLIRLKNEAGVVIELTASDGAMLELDADGATVAMTGPAPTTPETEDSEE